ncbi:LLM class flavin-dependent oxidoreductase [Xylanimonas sp. McL0601]|uniref:LLM class flavin-dependent oxidoreductase n=1 Tax=Xylanimonas sp. McL0601 TaxID=3414739 RepID=UPI003CEF4484
MPTTALPHQDRQVILAVDLTAAGARAHRTPGAAVLRPFDGERFVRLVRAADQGLLDLVVLDEPFMLHPGRGRVSGRLDPAVAAARVAPLTSGIGLVAALDTMHLEPAHVAAAIAAVDRASGGRSAWQVGCPAGVSPSDERWPVQAVADAARVARTWDQDVSSGGAALDAEGRFRVDHDGVRFAVRRASTGQAALPQGRPPVVMRVRDERCARIVGAVADVVRITVADPERALALRKVLHDAATDAGRDPRELRVLVEAYVVLGSERDSAHARLAMVEALEGPDVGGGGLVVAGTPSDLAGVITDWVDGGLADGFLLRPSALEADLDAVVRGLVPGLQQRGLFRERRAARQTLREALGLPGVPTAGRPNPVAARNGARAAGPGRTATRGPVGAARVPAPLHASDLVTAR